jgi:hypothetical protein
MWRISITSTTTPAAEEVAHVIEGIVLENA